MTAAPLDLQDLSDPPAAVADRVEGVFRRYAERGAFSSFDSSVGRKGARIFRMRWHRDRLFEVVFEPNRRTFRAVSLFPDAPSDPPMAANLRRFLKAQSSPDRPDHRRISSDLARIGCRTTSNGIDLVMHVCGDSTELAADRLIHLLNEIYLMFLSRPEYYDYRVEKLFAHPDWG